MEDYKPLSKEHSQHAKPKSLDYKTELRTLWLSIQDLSTLVNYLVGTTKALVQRMPLERWMSACSLLLP